MLSFAFIPRISTENTQAVGTLSNFLTSIGHFVLLDTLNAEQP